MSELTRLSAVKLAERIHRREISAVEVTQAHLDRVGAVDPVVHAFLHLDVEGALAAVAAFEAPLAIGTDTGGSIRQPSAVTGTVGVKPTYGGVSRYGLVAFSSSLDQGGPVARTVLDAALLHEVIGGYDPLDSTSIDEPVPPVVAAAPARATREL